MDKIDKMDNIYKIGRDRGWKEGRKEGRMEGWKDGWMDGWRERERMNTYKGIHIII